MAKINGYEIRRVESTELHPLTNKPKAKLYVSEYWVCNCKALNLHPTADAMCWVCKVKQENAQNATIGEVCERIGNKKW